MSMDVTSMDVNPDLDILNTLDINPNMDQEDEINNHDMLYSDNLTTMLYSNDEAMEFSI